MTGFHDPHACEQFRKLLADARFTDQGVCDVLGINETRAVSQNDLALLLHRTRGGTPLETLVRLFLVGVPVESEAASRAAKPMSLDDWIAAGLVVPRGTQISAELQLLPYQGLVIAFDQPSRLQSEQASQYVMGIAASSLTLAGYTVRRPAELTLDLGTGCGFLAFLAAGHSRRVLATDRNPRAVAIARFNAQLNGLDNVECREGSLFEPVRDDRFDLVVSNPPFVISPESRYIYRDSGLHGDQITQAIVREVPAHLAEGGYCQILCNWAHRVGEDWRDRLAGWFQGSDCDVWAMPTDTLSADAYAAKWIRHTERADVQGLDERFHQWIEHYKRLQIEAVSGGLIMMRRRSGSTHWYCTEPAPSTIVHPAGDSIEAIFAGRTLLASLADPSHLLDCRLRVSPHLRWHHTLEPAGGEWRNCETRLQMSRGLGYEGNVDPFLANLLGRCDGTHRLADLVAGLATSLGRPVSEVAPACVTVVTSLLERGMLSS